MVQGWAFEHSDRPLGSVKAEILLTGHLLCKEDCVPQGWLNS